jgi:hypothetical protein
LKTWLSLAICISIKLIILAISKSSKKKKEKLNWTWDRVTTIDGSIDNEKVLHIDSEEKESNGPRGN